MVIMRDDSIDHFMTPAVHTIGSDRPLREAHALMGKFRIRHLPVLEGGRLVGLISERDLAIVETLPSVSLDEVQVDDAMTSEVYAVERGTPLAEVASQMARHRYGSAVVMENGKVCGIFTAIDALRSLDFLLSSPEVRHVLHAAMIPAQGLPPA